MKSISYFLILFLLFLVWPFGAFMISLYLIWRSNISESEQTTCLIISSLFWGLLAFTQKSLAVEGTDSTRYYYSLEYYETFRPLEIWRFIDFSELLNFTFFPVSAFTVAFTGNVQSISFLWTTIVYLLTFLSVRKLMQYFDCYTNRSFAMLVLCLTFCFIAFVQVSELLKQSSSFAVFFYGFTLFLTGRPKLAVILLVIIAIGLHPSCMMLLPLFFYNKFKTRSLIIITIIVMVISQFVDIIDFLMNLLPGGNYTEMIIERFGGDYSEGGTLHYIALQILMLSPALFLWITGKAKEEKQRNAVNIILLYFLISSLNFGNLTAYLRLSILAHWLFALGYIICLKNIQYREVRLALIIIVFFMFFMTARWTIGRTKPGGYASSYMDNNIVNIVFSTSYEYLTVDYSK